MSWWQWVRKAFLVQGNLKFDTYGQLPRSFWDARLGDASHRFLECSIETFKNCPRGIGLWCSYRECAWRKGWYCGLCSDRSVWIEDTAKGFHSVSLCWSMIGVVALNEEMRLLHGSLEFRHCQGTPLCNFLPRRSGRFETWGCLA